MRFLRLWKRITWFVSIGIWTKTIYSSIQRERSDHPLGVLRVFRSAGDRFDLYTHLACHLCQKPVESAYVPRMLPWTFRQSYFYRKIFYERPENYTDSCSIPPSTISSYRLMTWLIHSCFEFKHYRVCKGVFPGPNQFRDNLYVNFWKKKEYLQLSKSEL